MATLESVGGLAMHVILSKLAPNDAASVACVSRRFRTWASDDDSLWSKFCSDDFQLNSPLDPVGNPTATFKEAYGTWRDAFHMYPWPLVMRVKRCWDRLKNWFAANFPEILATLRRGASEEEINALEMSLKVKLPLPTRVLYRFCDGQDLNADNLTGRVPQSLLGLIGGYSFYDHQVNVFLLPLEQIVEETKDYIQQLLLNGRPKYIVVAASCTYREKTFFLNCRSGQLHVGTRNLLTDGEMIPCVPGSLISLLNDRKGSQVQDALLLWLEEHCRRLESGIIKVRQDDELRGINLFPELPPLCCTAITNGVKVRASAVFVPEGSNLEDEDEKYLFAYTVRMSLSPEGCIISGMNFGSCQLYWRHWVIRIGDAVVDNVNGEAVFGKFPLLRPGEEEFIYESCTFLSSLPGSIEGCFTFVPGRYLKKLSGTRFCYSFFRSLDVVIASNQVS
nr:F-box protein SKIP16-like isoform X1 [Coffea arabica]